MTADEDAETVRLREQLQHEMAMSRASAIAYAENEAAYRSHAEEQSAQIVRLRAENATLREAIAAATATAATQATTIDGLERDLAASRLRAEQLFQGLCEIQRLADFAAQHEEELDVGQVQGIVAAIRSLPDA